MRVAIAEDSVLLREGLVRILEEADFEVVGQSTTADDLLLKVRSYSPDVAIVDIRCRPDTTMRGCARRWRFALTIRRSACSFSRSTSSSGLRWSCSPNLPRALGTC